MNKNLKILSSLAAAGIITVTGLTGSVSAATPRSLGVYRKVVTGKTIAPYILPSATDSLTAQNVRDDHGTITLNVSGNVKTGDTFKKNDETHHIVVYGDVNKDGYIDVNDVSLLVDNIIKTNRLDDIQRQAGNVAENVNNNQELNVNDISTLVDYVIKGGKFDIKLNEEEQPSTDYAYTLKANENGYVNADNIDGTTLYIGVKNPVNKDKTGLTLKVLDENGNEITALKKENITITANMTEVKVEDLDFSDVTLKDNKAKITLQLIEKVNKRDTVVGEAVIEINTNVPEITNVRTRRTGEYTATMSFEKLGESDIVKMYYKVVKSNATAPTIDPSDEDDKDLKVATISNNKLENFEVANNLESNSAYKVYYVLENSYGARTTTDNANIANDTTTSIEKAINEIKVPNLEDSTAVFSWTLQDGEVATGKTYVVTLYKDGVAVDTKEVSADTKQDFATEISDNKAGKYTVKVYVKGASDGSSQDSDVKESAAVEVKALNAVTNVQFVTRVNGDRVLTWSDSNAADDVNSYTVTLTPYATDGTEEAALTPIEDIDEKEVVLSLTDDVVYKAEVVACAKGNQMKVVSSEETESSRFLAIAAPTAVEVKDNSVTLELAKDIIVNNKKATYSVKVYEAKADQSDMLSDAAYNAPTLRENLTATDKKIVIDELKPGTKYAFQIIAKVDGIEGQSRVARTETKAAMPTISAVAVVKNANDAKGKTIFYNEGESKLVIEGKSYDVSSSSKYPELLKKVAQIVKALQEKDVVTLENQKVKLELKSEQTNSTPLALGEIAKDMTVEIAGNGFGKEITTSANGKPTEVILSGSGAIFTTTSLNAEKVTLNSGVDVKGNIKYTVAKGATVTINGVKVKTEQEAEITATGKKLEITANNVTNALEFENLTDTNHTDKNGDELEVSFKGDNETTYAGTIKITSNTGKITVKENNVGVSNVTLDVVVTDTDVDVSGFAQANNNVKVTVSEDPASSSKPTVTAKAKMKAPITMANKVLKIYEDTVEGNNQIITDFSLDADTVTEKEINDIRAFINSFGIDEVENATIDATEDSYDVVITFNEKTTGEVSIEGID